MHSTIALAASFIVLAVALLCPPVSEAKSVYRCTNKAGKVEFQDFPCDAAQRPPQSPSASPAPRATSPAFRPAPAESPALVDLDAQIAACLQIERRYRERNPLPKCAVGDQRCSSRSLPLIEARIDKMFADPEFQRLNCAILFNPQPQATGPDNFEVVSAVRGCKYFLAEQNGSISLVEDWLCSRPSKGDTGTGDISSPGIREVNLSGQRCTVYVDDWLLSKRRAEDKLADKCGR